ncbi:MAG: thioredoxin family protein [Geitlerinemataceae cyanobacterium]
MSNVVTIQDPAFETEVLKSPTPVLVYFWAPWCGPCRLVSPSIEKIAAEYSDRLKVVKMEVDPCPETVKQYQVEGVPALRLFQNAELIATHEGAIIKSKLIDWIDSSLP